MGKSLSYLSSNATQTTNTTGETSAILEVDPSDGTLLRLLNMVASGEAEGLPIYQDLNDAAGNDLPADTKFILRVQRPTDDEPVAVSVADDNIAPWNGLSIKEQRNEENIDQVKIELKGEVVNIRPQDILTFEINSSTQIDWSNSELYVARKGVEAAPYEG